MTKINRIFVQGLIIISLFSLSSCRTPSKLTHVEAGRTEMSAAWENPATEAASIVQPYQEKIDSIMSPVVGISAMDMSAARPESLLSNLIADVLRLAAVPHIGRQADLGLINVGGLRNSLKAGEITYGEVFEILPFENTFCILTLKGKYLKELVESILIPGGEGISNMQIKATKDRKLVSVTIGGEPIDDERLYTIATIDYLAEGNDKMTALLKAESKTSFEDKTIREVFLDYIKAQTAAGKEITSQMDGRITVVE